MYVCLCTGVTDRDIRKLAANGSDAESIMRCTGAGTRCGSCRPTIAALVQLSSAPSGSPDPAALDHVLDPR